VAWTPQLNITCGRCGKPRGLKHVCVSSSKRKATVKAGWSFGQCPKCRKTITNPLAHTCRPKSDFKRRRGAASKQEAKEKRAQSASIAKVGRSRQHGPAKAKHDYQACTDKDCERPLCVAYKTGYKTGHFDGYEEGYATGWDRGYRAGYNRGFPDGIAACPRAHK
jgi:hypothetical protein